jgi:hypothetical protein
MWQPFRATEAMLDARPDGRCDARKRHEAVGPIVEPSIVLGTVKLAPVMAPARPGAAAGMRLRSAAVAPADRA